MECWKIEDWNDEHTVQFGDDWCQFDALWCGCVVALVTTCNMRGNVEFVAVIVAVLAGPMAAMIAR